MALFFDMDLPEDRAGLSFSPILKLDDSNQSVRLENGEGVFAELLTDTGGLRAATDLEIGAPGRSIVIRGAKVDFQTGRSIEPKTQHFPF